MFRIAEDNNEEALRKQKIYYDNHAKSRINDFKIGDKVMVTIEETKLGGKSKIYGQMDRPVLCGREKI